MRCSRFIALACLLVLGGCYEPSIEGLIDPDPSCEFSVDGSIRKVGVLDVGPSPGLAHAYEGVMLVEGRPEKEVTSASVAFSSKGERLPNVIVNGQEYVFPSVEGERHSPVVGRTDASGRAAVPFQLVTEEEAVALQALIDSGETLELLVELRAVIGGRGTTYPSFVDLEVCETCLVGVGAQLQGGELICADGTPPTPVEPVPCREGQDDVFSRCDAD